MLNCFSQHALFGYLQLLQPTLSDHMCIRFINSSTKNPCDMAETPTNHLLCVLDLRHQSVRKDHPTLAIRNFTYRYPLLVVLPPQANQSGFGYLLMVSQRACTSDSLRLSLVYVLWSYLEPVALPSSYKCATCVADGSQTLGLSTWPSV
jgi:hypothetical protein